MLALVKAFLKAGVLTELGERQDTHTGTPQGGIVSPLLANIALWIGLSPAGADAGVALFVLGFSLVFIGPTLGAVLGLAAVGGGDLQRGPILLFAYSLGLGVPFLIAALGFHGTVGRFPALRHRFRLGRASSPRRSAIA